MDVIYIHSSENSIGHSPSPLPRTQDASRRDLNCPISISTVGCESLGCRRCRSAAVGVRERSATVTFVCARVDVSVLRAGRWSRSQPQSLAGSEENWAGLSGAAVPAVLQCRYAMVRRERRIGSGVQRGRSRGVVGHVGIAAMPRAQPQTRRSVPPAGCRLLK
jgi:hypothetical protein